MELESEISQQYCKRFKANDWYHNNKPERKLRVEGVATDVVSPELDTWFASETSKIRLRDIIFNGREVYA